MVAAGIVRCLHAALVGGVLFATPIIVEAAGKPNVVVFYMDDLAYADPGCYGGTLTPTPNIDALAKNGVRFTDGYVSACVCGPSRVGLMTGRYQARFGLDSNGGKQGRDLPADEKTIAHRMKEAGYTCGIVGKWHLGSSSPEFLPPNRGFDFAVGSVGNLGEGGEKTGFFRGDKLMATIEGAPVTSPPYAREACGFIDAHREQPFFLYLAFNAVHNPNVASDEVLQRFPKLSKHQLAYAANFAEADDAVGTVMSKLRSLGLEENTLVFFISDNGGSSPFAFYDGLRGSKWYLWEGGVRVPWIVQWKGRIPGGRVVSEPVIQLDVLPTALAAAGREAPADAQLDGVNLLPLLTGETANLPERPLFFRFGVQYAVRSGDWKLVKASLAMEPALFNLASDKGEQTDLAKSSPEKFQELQATYDRWNATMKPALWEERRSHGDEESKDKRKARKKAKAKAAE